MPLLEFMKPRKEKKKSTIISLQLVDSLVKYPKGIAKDVLVEVSLSFHSKLL